MADISKSTHDTMIAAVKAVKDTYPNAFYIQRVLNKALIDLNASFQCTDVTSDALHAPVANQAISATSDPIIHSPGQDGLTLPAAPAHDVVKS
jgi:hypothetical protein